jgi:hypothetical protein
MMRTCVLLAIAAALAVRANAGATPPRFLAVDNGGNRLLLVDQSDPARGWSVPIPAGSRDLQQLDGRRVLLSHGDGAGEYDLADGKKVWSVSGFKGVSTARRCKDGTTVLGSNDGGRVRFLWVDRDGKEVRRQEPAGCADLRLARETESGGLLFTAGNPPRVVETDAKGAVTWTAKLAGKGYVAYRMPDGTTWATTGETCTVAVLDRDGKEVRRLGGKDAHPQARLLWFSGFQPLADGGAAVANWCGHGKEKQGPHVVAFDAQNRLAWVWEDHAVAKTVTNVLVLEAGAPLDIRIENLTVQPSTGPLAQIQLRNRGEKALQGRLQATFPPAWKMNKTAQEFALRPGETKRIAFAIEKGADDPANAYPVAVEATLDGATVTTSRTITAATAPFFKPVIDGTYDDWNDAVPVTFVTQGKKTTIKTFWSQRMFSALIAVEENKLVGMGGAPAFDAVQLAFAPRDAVTPGRDDASDQRYEFVMAAKADASGACFTLYQPEQKLSVAKESRALAGLETPGAHVSVRHDGGWTYYELAIPFTAMPALQPEPGREFCFSVLVHDPDGTGLRDWGEAAALGPDQRKRLAWCVWQGAQWPQQAPYDNKIEWGFCSSKQ